MKKFLSLLLALVMLFALSSAAFAATFPPSGFKDVPKGAWYEEAVNFVKYADLMNGVSDDRFDPNGKVTRAMVVTVLYRLAGKPGVSGKTNPFVDVSNDGGNWYRDAVIWAYSAKVTDGMDANRFAPNVSITREQMASMLIRFFSASDSSSEMKKALDMMEGDAAKKLVDKELNNIYKDAGSISDYARTNVYICYLTEVMTGDDRGMFCPKDPLTRAQCAQIFLNLYKISENA